ncbi:MULTISPECIES: DUF2285 domain-containing protein [Mesorhizobium]|uniref:DNA -binding domain-containing protein n=1 Tax=Mesorhizobium TaxID=68287 RepID=UPI0007FD88F2|nr:MULTISPECIES: DUF2285 domain-containing protein [Mesorhizobium]RVC66670.1 DUF2285 domain-containing protein [Mesorhizobium sp. M2A.F.Ca.ET.046.02.1.1]AZO39311.1 DUF2285 domain-containing protein [Mesorhizobium sp. M2A.F.Ca.ET.046.03.2.1]AZO75822.1 DUF2285 domain-containing protein [Mesorhizobium sp. M1D.F.Ca.ET.043.01.1.1]MUT27202.1 DUF2285 domain-containing protein [Mesorhizobium japonicum]OBQ84911.1 hypothetical protein A9K71_21380 [Mesorhizobium sp. WSM3873]
MNRSTGTDGTESSALLDQVPWSDSITSYDRQHSTIYLRILDACADDASVEEMAELILGIDPVLEPVRARKAVRSHIDRANWMVTTGYKELFGG